MKAEMNSENKAKFFAQYWGLEVLEVPNLIYTGNPPEPSHEEWGSATLNSFYFPKIIDSGFPLWLKPLSSICDEDVIQLSKLMDQNFEGFDHTDIPVEEIIEFRNDIVDVLEEIYYPLVISDFLRSRSYAIPWFGLSVEEMVEAGWIKLT